MNSSPHITHSSSPSTTHPVSKLRWALSIVLGTILFLFSLLLSEFIPTVIFDLPSVGMTFALVGVIRFLLGSIVVALSLRLVHLRLQDVGLTSVQWRSDFLIGAGIALIFALLQFLIIIPNTGGATRTDIVANTAQMGESFSGMVGFIILAWTGAFAEELFFRGQLITALRNLLGNTPFSLFLTIFITVVLFAAGHGYQGWAGILDTGLYGGLLMSLLYLWRGRLTAPIVAHAMWNTVASIVLFLWI